MVEDNAPNLVMGVADQSHHNKTTVAGNGSLFQHYGAVQNRITTTYMLSQVAQPKLPPLPRCPAPSPNYTSRKLIEDLLFSYFFSGKPGMKCFVLSGPGGVGKTEVALAFVNTHVYQPPAEHDAKRFAEVIWIDATNAETIKESFKVIALSLGTGPEPEDVLRWLAIREGRNSNWIILFNNADDPKLDLIKYFPKCSHGNILITTRNYHARRHGIGSGSHYVVSEMTPDEALIVFMKYACLSDNPSPSLIEAVKILVEELGHFALSVSHAGAFTSASPYNPSEYLDLYRERRQDLLQEHEQMKLTTYQYQTVHATWMINYEGLDEPTKRFVRVCGRLYYQGIGEVMFSKACSGGVDKLDSHCGRLFTESEKAGMIELKKLCESLSTNGIWDVMKFRRLVGRLQSYSLMTFDGDQKTCSFHPLVHEWAGNLGDVEEQSVLRQCATLLLGSSLVAFDTAEDLAYSRGLASHVDRVFEGINTKSSAYGGRFARVYREAGRWSDAVAHMESYKELCIKGLGEEHLHTLTSILDLAVGYWLQHRLGEAEPLYLQVAETRKRILGAEHPDTLDCLGDLALNYHSQRRFDEAEALGLQVVKALEKVMGAEHPETLSSIANLALTYDSQQRYDEAEGLQLKVMDIRKRIMGVEHPDTLLAIGNLAGTYRSQQRFAEAEPLEWQVMEARKRVLGAEHPHTLHSMGNLALTYSGQRRFDEAEVLQLRVMEARKRVLGVEHPDTLKVMYNLANTYREQGNLEKGHKLAQQTFVARANVLGADHPDTISSAELLVRIESLLSESQSLPSESHSSSSESQPVPEKTQPSRSRTRKSCWLSKLYCSLF